MDSERLQRLLQRHLDQILTTEERAELEQMLLASPRARAAFWETARWHALVRQWGEAEWGRSGVVSEIPLPSRQRPRRGQIVGWAAAAAVVLTAGGLAWWAKQSTLFPENSRARAERSATPESTEVRKDVAVLTRLLDVKWPAGEAVRNQGEVLLSGRFQMDAGAAEMETLRGARLVLEGPVKLSIHPDGDVTLESGVLWMKIPDSARGTQVRAGDWRITDAIGTLGLVVESGQRMAVHVLQGQAQMKPVSGEPPRRLESGQALFASVSGIDLRAADVHAFTSDAQLNERAATAARRKLESWRGYCRELDRREDLLVHLDFERQDSGLRTLPNRAERAPANSGASLVGCDWVEGRWPGKGAVEFKHGNERLWLNVPGDMNALTLLAWVRVDSLPNSVHALLTADSPGGNLRWALRKDGTLSFGLQVPHDGKGLLAFRSETAVRPEQVGTWLCLGTVLSTEGTVTHYINGEFAGRGRLKELKRSCLGKCEIGNAAEETAKNRTGTGAGVDQVKNFVGRLDEFAIFSTALGPDEVRRFHSAGRGDR